MGRKKKRNNTEIKTQTGETPMELSQFHDDSMSFLPVCVRHCLNDDILLWSSWGPHSATQDFVAPRCFSAFKGGAGKGG